MTSPMRVIFSIVDGDAVYEGLGPKNDPWQGFANGQSQVDAFSFTCTGIKPTRDYAETWLCRVDIQIKRRGKSSAPWEAKFLMHPTFDETELLLKATPEDGVAKDHFWSIGPFVVGAVVMEGGAQKTRLELDLTKYKGTSIDRAPDDWWTR
jgi:hypothetical protein